MNQTALNIATKILAEVNQELLRKIADNESLPKDTAYVVHFDNDKFAQSFYAELVDIFKRHAGFKAAVANYDEHYYGKGQGSSWIMFTNETIDL